MWEKNAGASVASSGAVTLGQKLAQTLTATTSLTQSFSGLWKTGDFKDSLHVLSLGQEAEGDPARMHDSNLSNTGLRAQAHGSGSSGLRSAGHYSERIRPHIHRIFRDLAESGGTSWSDSDKGKNSLDSGSPYTATYGGLAGVRRWLSSIVRDHRRDRARARPSAATLHTQSTPASFFVFRFVIASRVEAFFTRSLSTPGAVVLFFSARQDISAFLCHTQSRLVFRETITALCVKFTKCFF